jgi:hypothetical protein
LPGSDAQLIEPFPDVMGVVVGYYHLCKPGGTTPLFSSHLKWIDLYPVNPQWKICLGSPPAFQA